MLSLSVRKFGLSQKCRGLRFWGKFFGTKSNYYVLESDTDEVVHNEDISFELRQNKATEKVNRQEEFLDVLDLDSLIKPDWKPPPVIPPENPGKGLNRKVYHVCNTLGEPWIRLPDVSPNQVRITFYNCKIGCHTASTFVISFTFYYSLGLHFR